jgi:phosphopantetheinyl transferase (holo-ACP synthase)
VSVLLRTGVDLVNVGALQLQIKQSATDFLARFLTDAERAAVGDNMASIAAR